MKSGAGAIIPIIQMRDASLRDGDASGPGLGGAKRPTKAAPARGRRGGLLFVIIASGCLVALPGVQAAERPADPPPPPHGAKPAKAKPKPKAGAGALPFVPPLTIGWPDTGSVALDEKGITARGAGDGPTLAIGGRIHLDASAARLRPRSLGPALTDNGEIRRAWFEPTLTLPNGFVANLQYDFSTTTQPVNNALLAYRGFDHVIVTIGNFKEPFSLDQLISNDNTLFVERSLLDIFAPGRDFGGAVGTNGKNWTAVGGVFGGNINTDLASGGIAGTARLTYAPILREDEVLHFGLAGSYRSLDGGGTPLSFDVGPEDDLAAQSLVSTGPLATASNVGRVGLEALYQMGSARVQAEYAVTTVGGRDRRGSGTFQAGYIQAAWVINGEGPAYTLAPTHGSEYAILGGVKVPDSQRLSNGGVGVFELGARFSAVTLESAGIRGGREYDGTLGLNWYPDSNVKLMANYIRAHADPAALSLANGGNADSDSVVARLQFYW